MLDKKMTNLVSKHVKAYQSDFTEHDLPYLKAHAKPGDLFFWLLRESGTQLYNFQDLIAKDKIFGSLEQLLYFRTYKKKLYTILVSENKSGVLYGEIKKVDYNQATDNLRMTMRTPKVLKILLADGKAQYIDWCYISEFLSSSQLFEYIKTNYLPAIDRWSDMEYEIIY